MTALDTRALRDAFGAFPTGVTVVTTRGPDGTPVGFTANAFTSVSLDPPLLLVCPAKSLSSYPVFEACTVFAVNVLAEGQEAVANTFAGFKGDRFARISWHQDTAGRPLIDGAAARFSCTVHDRVDAGDHLILLGRIDGFARSDERGLGYAAGGYFSLGLERQAGKPPAPDRRTYTGAIVEYGDSVLLEETPQGFRPFRTVVGPTGTARTAITNHLASIGVTAEIGPVYSIFEDRGRRESFVYFRAIATEPLLHTPGRFVPACDTGTLRHISSAHAEMFRRYADERQGRAFGLYVGDEAAGDVHAFPQEASR